MLIQADARQLPLRDVCVQCVITSPPYWGLRDYGVGNQIGLEATPAAYVANLVQVFTEVRRVLADDGVLWLNLGDSYTGGKTGRDDQDIHIRVRGGVGDGLTNSPRGQNRAIPTGAKPKDLVGIPWRVAFALQADGWYLRSDIIWSKPNPMPESVTDRPTKAHEYLFLLTKSERYRYDADAIREPNTAGTLERLASGPVQPKSEGPKNLLGRRDGGIKPYTGQATKDYDAAGAQNPSDTKRRILAAMEAPEYIGRNKRSVWTINAQPFSGAHFATMPEKLVEPCILAGCPIGGLVFDPFLGSGTVGAVAERLGRRWVGTDLNSAYHTLAKARTRQRGLRFSTETEEPPAVDAVDPGVEQVTDGPRA